MDVGPCSYKCVNIIVVFYFIFVTNGLLNACCLLVCVNQSVLQVAMFVPVDL